ncbi:MAG TPA: SLC13 family permease [Stellaceae bacterium]|nr:SLC13 family permease [Stellaceae bacterium]
MIVVAFPLPQRPAVHAAIIILVFVATYIGMAAGRFPWLQVDRTGIALLGVIALLASRTVTLDDLGANIDTSTLVLLFALMIISAQFAAAGVYDVCADWILSKRTSPAMLLALTVAVCGGLSALLANDIVTFIMAPLLIAGARGRGLDPRPFLIALAGASNAGSAATLIGNPQNILIGQIGSLSFPVYLFTAIVPAAIALVVFYAVIWLLWHDRIDGTVMAVTREVPDVPRHPFDRNQAIKAVVAMALLLGLFMTPLPRDIGGLLIAAILLSNRKITSRTMIASVDWPLLLLFVCLFAITGALADTGLPWSLISGLDAHGLLPSSLAVLAPLTLAMSNTIGNVPSVVLLLQVWPNPPQGALYGLALLSSLAGNLLLIGSLANFIVVERAATYGVRLSFGEYARVGVPATLVSMAFAVAWLAWTGWLPWLPGGAN